ncbi:MAG: hypothetical protein R3C46_03355 [Hyphomonadaceae bacterium]
MRAGLVLSSLALIGLAACAPAATEKPAAETPTAEASTPMARPITLPVSINAVMVALVDHASEPLWLDAYEPPTTDEGWRAAEHHAYQMAVGGKLIQLAGTGPNDETWVAEPKWIRMADEMSAAGMDALAAAKARNVDLLNTAGDRLVAACEACHKEYKLGLPSMGIYKSPDYPIPER